MRILEWWFAWPVAAIVLAVIALGPLGEQVLRRGVVFLDLAIAQAAAAAALLAGALINHPAAWIVQVCASVGALAATMGVVALNRQWDVQREALIGLVYVLCAALALLVARADPHGAQRLTALLAADVLWVGSVQLGWLGAAAAVVTLLRLRLDQDLWFYPVFALVVSLAVPVLGVFLVFALLIAPALWVLRGLGAAQSLVLTGAVACTGLGVSWWADWPSGTCVALGLALLGLASVSKIPR